MPPSISLAYITHHTIDTAAIKKLLANIEKQSRKVYSVRSGAISEIDFNQKLPSRERKKEEKQAENMFDALMWVEWKFGIIKDAIVFLWVNKKGEKKRANVIINYQIKKYFLLSPSLFCFVFFFLFFVVAPKPLKSRSNQLFEVYMLLCTSNQNRSSACNSLINFAVPPQLRRYIGCRRPILGICNWRSSFVTFFCILWHTQCISDRINGNHIATADSFLRPLQTKKKRRRWCSHKNNKQKNERDGCGVGVFFVGRNKLIAFARVVVMTSVHNEYHMRFVRSTHNHWHTTQCHCWIYRHNSMCVCVSQQYLATPIGLHVYNSNIVYSVFVIAGG